MIYKIATFDPVTDKYTEEMTDVDVSSEGEPGNLRGLNVRVDLPKPDCEPENHPSLFIERQTRGWAVIIHTDDGDPRGAVMILDNGTVWFEDHDGNVVHREELFDESP